MATVGITREETTEAGFPGEGYFCRRGFLTVFASSCRRDPISLALWTENLARTDGPSRTPLRDAHVAVGSRVQRSYSIDEK
jgi:hypothetical protein